MDLKDTLWLSYTDLTEKKVRTALTIFMVIIGVAAIVALVSLTAGISAAITNELASLGPTSILVVSTKATGFTPADTAAISSLPNASVVVPIVSGSGTLYSDSQNSSVSVVGIAQEDLPYIMGGNSTLYEGSLYNDTIAPDALIGYSVAFPSTSGGRAVVTVGQPATLKIGSGRSVDSYTIPVEGITKSFTSALIPVDSSVLMSLPAAESLLHKTSFNELLVEAKNASGVTPLTTLLTDIYGSNARIINTQQLATTAASITGSITILLVVIAGISLLVAAVGIMNIMLMSVMEKTHEIGIMKSIGFRNIDVMRVFLFQALIIGLIGGILGILVGAGASFGLSAAATAASSSSPSSSSGSLGTGASGAAGGGATFRTSSGNSGFAGGGARGGGSTTFVAGGGASASSSSSSLSFSPVISPALIAEALFVAVFVSMIAGIYPAWRASKMQPIDALRQL